MSAEIKAEIIFLKPSGILEDIHTILPVSTLNFALTGFIAKDAHQSKIWPFKSKLSPKIIPSWRRFCSIVFDGIANYCARCSNMAH